MASHSMKVLKGHFKITIRNGVPTLKSEFFALMKRLNCLIALLFNLCRCLIENSQLLFAHRQCDQMARLRFLFWPFTAIKLCRIA